MIIKGTISTFRLKDAKGYLVQSSNQSVSDAVRQHCKEKALADGSYEFEYDTDTSKVDIRKA